jgi:hypothetical protein
MFLMMHKHTWKVLNWNVRGLNLDKKWNSIRSKIVESRSEIVCLQVTKRDAFDINFISKFCPRDFDSFEFMPSIGASGRIIVIWKSLALWGTLVFSNRFVISVEFTSKLCNDTWLLTTIYAPCTPLGKREFLEWFKEIQMPDEIDWLIVDDFNLMRKLEYRNREGADLNEIFLFNEAINNLNLIELPLHGTQFTWTTQTVPTFTIEIRLVFHFKLLDCQVP